MRMPFPKLRNLSLMCNVIAYAEVAFAILPVQMVNVLHFTVCNAENLLDILRAVSWICQIWVRMLLFGMGKQCHQIVYSFNLQNYFSENFLKVATNSI